MNGVDLAIVGGGAAGAMVLAHVARAATRTMRVVLIDDGPGRLGTGTAYRTHDDAHLLNVRASAMSAWQDQPEHFTHWLAATGRAHAAGSGFMPRATYGAYLSSVAYDAANGESVDTRLIRGQVTAVRRQFDGWSVAMSGGGSLAATQIVLALGIEPPALRWVPRRLRCMPRFIADPWRPDALDAIAPDDRVLIIGTGLTAVDVAVTLSRRVCGPIVATSRHGLIPAGHTEVVSSAMPVEAGSLPATVAELRRLLHRRIRESVASCGDWRPAIDGLRPYTQRIWSALPAVDRAEFLHRDLRRWENARHRMAPAIAAEISDLLADGRLTIAAEHPMVAVATAQPDTWIINATGPAADLTQSSNPLVQQLFADGYVTAGPLRIGWDTTGDGQIRDPLGNPVPGLWTMGSTRRGQLLESTAVPEVRAQAQNLADRILASLPADTAPAAAGPQRVRGHSTIVRTDAYGQPLLTTVRAAEHFNDAVTRVLRVQHGAGDALDAALAEDPSFALGHAARAMLAFEGVVDADALSALDTAEQAAQKRADSRTSSFLYAVTARIRRGDPSGLLAHIRDFPRDALVVNACVPTIAFSGVTEVPQQAWAIVEQLAPVYGSDWWYLGLLAFIRQEQHRWAHSAELAERALAADPAGGHAVHARSHVYYETGEHIAGLRWLDGWIQGPGHEASHRAHYAWHAALHELALGRRADVWTRFRTQLAPPSVTGVRALVDSASLLWRCHLFGVWPLPLPIGDVIGAVPDNLLREPPTGFIAMHAALALAAAGDVTGLNALRRYASGRPEPVFGLVAALVTALTAYATGDYPLAASTIARHSGEWVQLGGSDAQREVIDDTLLSALIHAGQCDTARVLVEARTDAPARTSRSRGPGRHQRREGQPQATGGPA